MSTTASNSDSPRQNVKRQKHDTGETHPQYDSTIPSSQICETNSVVQGCITTDDCKSKKTKTSD